MSETPGTQSAPPANDTGGSGTGVSNERLMAGLAYFIFFLPMLMNPRSEFAMFHAKQSLVLLITIILGNAILTIIPIIGWLIMPLFNLLVFVFVILGLINGLNGKQVELPAIGQFAKNFKF